jgi:hypothetical protein
MKLRALFMTLIAAAFLFAGCVNQATEVVEEDDGLDARIYGSWNRTANYVDGASVGSAGSTIMFLEDGTYTSFGTCTVNGAYIVIDDVLSSTIDNTDCKGYSGPYEYTSTFRISEDGEDLTIDSQYEGHLVTETFVRATE